MPAEAKPVLGQLRVVSERLFPTACHRQRVAHLGQQVELVTPVADSASVRERLLEDFERLFIAVALEAGIREVPIRRGGRGRQIVFERVTNGMSLERELLLQPTPGSREHRLYQETADQRLREAEGLGDLERELDRLDGAVVRAGEGVGLSQARCKVGHVGVGLVRGHGCECTLEPLAGLFASPREHFDMGDPAQHAGRGVALVSLLQKLECGEESSLRRVELRTVRCHCPRPLEKTRLLERLVRKLGRLLEVLPRLSERGK